MRKEKLLIDNMPGEKFFYMHISSCLLVCYFAIRFDLTGVPNCWVSCCLMRWNDHLLNSGLLVQCWAVWWKGYCFCFMEGKEGWEGSCVLSGNDGCQPLGDVCLETCQGWLVHTVSSCKVVGALYHNQALWQCFVPFGHTVPLLGNAQLAQSIISARCL